MADVVGPVLRRLLDEVTQLREERDGLRARILGLAEAYEGLTRKLRGQDPETRARASVYADDVAEAIRRCL